MKLKKEDIRHIAELARLELNSKEISKYTHDLSAILDYVNMLEEVDTDKIEPTAQVSGLMDVFRKDEIKPWSEEEVEMALSQSEREGGAIKVKRVL